jgi:ribosomal protein S18 acetylase RimI-like enzyme
VFVAEIDGIIVGAITIRFLIRLARIESLAVHEQLRRQLIGLRLLRRAERIAAVDHRCLAMRLEVREDNTDAVRLYLRNGYHVIGRKIGYYTDGTDALKFEKVL